MKRDFSISTINLVHFLSRLLVILRPGKVIINFGPEFRWRNSGKNTCTLTVEKLNSIVSRNFFVRFSFV